MLSVVWKAIVAFAFVLQALKETQKKSNKVKHNLQDHRKLIILSSDVYRRQQRQVLVPPPLILVQLDINVSMVRDANQW